MSIIRKVKSVERLFAKLDQEILGFRSETGIFCVPGCGKCCTKPDIEASPLEFLPLALHWFLTGKATEILDKLEAMPKDSICLVYSPLSPTELAKGSCSLYPYRGLICRLFGYSANRDKLGQLRMITCKVIKEGQVAEFTKATNEINGDLKVPIFTDYYKKLMQIDFRLGNTLLPVNQAIKEALEVVLQYYAYRPFPKVKKFA